MAWSYTSLTSFETCPYRFYKTRVDKTFPEPQSDSMLWGNYVHKALELRLTESAPLPNELAKYEQYAAPIQAFKGSLAAERRVTISNTFKEVEWDSPDAWCRGIFDVVVDQGKHVIVLDWKTGKRKADHDQLKLFAALSSIVYPSAVHFSTLYIWLKVGQQDSARYVKADVPKIWGEFVSRVKRMDDAYAKGDFCKKPSGLCRRYCPVKSCQFCGA